MNSSWFKLIKGEITSKRDNIWVNDGLSSATSDLQIIHRFKNTFCTCDKISEVTNERSCKLQFISVHSFLAIYLWIL